VKLLNSNYTSLIKIIIKEENFKWHLEAFAPELFNYTSAFLYPWPWTDRQSVINKTVIIYH